VSSKEAQEAGGLIRPAIANRVPVRPRPITGVLHPVGPILHRGALPLGAAVATITARAHQAEAAVRTAAQAAPAAAAVHTADRAVPAAAAVHTADRAVPAAAAAPTAQADLPAEAVVPTAQADPPVAAAQEPAGLPAEAPDLQAEVPGHPDDKLTVIVLPGSQNGILVL
jgi:hypothetical protein